MLRILPVLIIALMCLSCAYQREVYVRKCVGSSSVVYSGSLTSFNFTCGGVDTDILKDPVADFPITYKMIKIPCYEKTIIKKGFLTSEEEK